jgi:hypothetical protein
LAAANRAIMSGPQKPEIAPVKYRSSAPASKGAVTADAPLVLPTSAN